MLHRVDRKWTVLMTNKCIPSGSRDEYTRELLEWGNARKQKAKREANPLMADNLNLTILELNEQNPKGDVALGGASVLDNLDQAVT